MNITTTNFTTLTICPIWNFFKSQLTSKAKKKVKTPQRCRSSLFLLEANNKQALKKTVYDMNVFQRFLDECCEKRRITEIPPAELDSLLCNFYITAKKTDNTEYAPDTISTFSRSAQRYLDDNSAKINILKDEEFRVSREVLKSKRRELRKQGKGNKPNATVALANEDIERIFDENQFGILILMSFHVRSGSCSLSTSATEPDTKQGR